MTSAQALAKARRVRAQQRTHRIWDEVRAYRGNVHPECRCDLRAGMTAEQMRTLGAGCTSTLPDGRPGWVCEVLDYYRRLVGV